MAKTAIPDTREGILAEAYRLGGTGIVRRWCNLFDAEDRELRDPSPLGRRRPIEYVDLLRQVHKLERIKLWDRMETGWRQA